MDKNAVELYKRALSEGKVSVHNIRVMVVGHYGVGKTTLTKHLLNQDVDINQRESTDGIDVRRCKISLDTGRWSNVKKDQKKETICNRLVKLLQRSYHKTLETEDKELASDADDETDVVEGFIQASDRERGKRSTVEKSVEQEENKEEILGPTVKPSQVGNTELDLDLEGNEEFIHNQLKEWVEESQRHIADDDDTETADISVWDFAGQYVFYASHQVFLSRRAVYLLVTDVSKNVEDIVQDDDCFPDSKGAKHWKVSEFVDFWLRSIHEFCSSTEDVGPPVLLVGTFADQINKDEKHGTIDEFFYKLRSFLSDKVTFRHLIDDDFAIDNSVVDTNLELLRKEILNTASTQPYWGELIPAKWLTLENIIVGLKDKGLKVLYKSKLHDLNNTLPVPIETEEELELFLRFHHDSGNVLYYSDYKLNDSIVTDPQWLIDAFKSLITARMFCCRKPKNIFEKWKRFEESAVLTQELTEAIWHKNSVFHEHQQLLLDYLEKLGFIAKARELSDDTKVEDYYFAPCVLKTSPPEELLTCINYENRRSTSKLCFTAKSGFLPTAVFNRLLSYCLSKWPLTKKDGKHLIYCGCGIFDLEENHTLYVYFFDNVIQIWITKLSTTDQEPNTLLCSNVYVFVSELLQTELRMSCSIEVSLRCQRSGFYSNDYMFPMGKIAENQDVVCRCREKEHVFQTHELTKYWCYSKADHQESVLTDKGINRIAHNIGKEYQSLGFELGLSQAEIDQINLDYKYTVDRMYRMLLKWKKKEGAKVSLEKLTNAMESVGIDPDTVLESAKITR